MNNIKVKPWAAGPKELLDHADSHIRSTKAFDRRIAFISIDNAVELMIHTYLTLPKRARGREGPPRKRMEASIGFPDLLDLLEEYASDLISGIELGDLEWFHRIRNNLYHEGNGITVAEEQLESYRAVAGVLYENLFGLKLVTPSPSATGAFLDHWAELENRLRTAAMKYTRKPQRMPPEALLQVLLENGVIDETFVSGFSKLRQERNVIAHGYSIGGFDAAYIIQELTTLTNALPPWRTD